MLTKGLKKCMRNAGIRDGPEQESQREAVRSQGECHGRREIRVALDQGCTALGLVLALHLAPGPPRCNVSTHQFLQSEGKRWEESQPSVQKPLL